MSLYREIANDEFRGEGYFEAEWSGTKEWLPATPPRWKFAVYPGDKFMLLELGNDHYRIVGVKSRQDARWGIPLPEYKSDVEYRVWGRQLKNLTPRMALT